jgi:ABC-type sugar transport system ATPase subunit
LSWDEPTASLSVKAIAPAGVDETTARYWDGIVLIPPHVQDILLTGDRVMVMRRGSCVGGSPTDKASVEEVTGLITGRGEAFGMLPDHAEHYPPPSAGYPAG